MSKTITLIRHAESTFNIGQSGTNDCNPRLTINGIQNSEALHGSYDLVILSPLKRALETYLNSNIAAKEVMISPLFRERLGCKANCLEGEQLTDLETLEQLTSRVLSAGNFVNSLNCKTIAIISHHDFLSAFSTLIIRQNVRLANCQSFTFTINVLPPTAVVTEPVTPVATEPATPVATEPATHVATETVTPVATEPATPVATETAATEVTPVVTESVTAVATESVTPVATEPATPVATEYVTPVVTEPATPVPAVTSN